MHAVSFACDLACCVVQVEDLRFKRILFGGFPCYSNGPLPPAFDRVMQVRSAAEALGRG